MSGEKIDSPVVSAIRILSPWGFMPRSSSSSSSSSSWNGKTFLHRIRGGDDNDVDGVQEYDNLGSTTATATVMESSSSSSEGGGDGGVTVMDQPAPATTTTTTTTATEAIEEEEPSLDDKVYAAMKKLGMSPPSPSEAMLDEDSNCQDGVCTIPSTTTGETSANTLESLTSTTPLPQTEQDPNILAKTIAKDMKVDPRLAMAAIGATSTFGGDQNQRIYDEQAARDMIQYELDLIEKIPLDDPNVEQLVQEGYDAFLSRRALAFAENNMDDARAILIADQMDAEEEEAEEAAAAAKEESPPVDEEEEVMAQLREEAAAAKKQKQPDLVEIKTDFDPLATAPKADPNPPGDMMPKPAAKETVVFEATTAQLQELVLESPVPVLLDIYADWYVRKLY